MYRKRLAVSIFATLFVLAFSYQKCWSTSYSPNVHWVFCIDTSGSMKEKGHVDLLRLITEKIATEFLDVKHNIIKSGDRITVFSFDDDARLEVTSFYQTEGDLVPVKERLKEMNKRFGNVTFISEAIMNAVEFIKKYDAFFHTSALYVFTDGKSEPYSNKWPEATIEARKKRDKENIAQLSFSVEKSKLNIWVGVLKWVAYNDAKTFVEKIGVGGHLVDLTDFTRLSLERALKNFAQTVRYKVNIQNTEAIDFGTIPYTCKNSYEESISLEALTDMPRGAPLLEGMMTFDPENPSEIDKDYVFEIKTLENRIILGLNLSQCDTLNAGMYRGTLKLHPSAKKYGALIIEPSQFTVQFKKAGFLGSYFWKIALGIGLLALFLLYLINKIKIKLPIKV